MSPQKWSKNRLYAVGGGLAVVALGCGIWGWAASRPPAPDADPVVVAKFVGTEDFKSLPDEEKRAYLENLRPNMRELREAADSGEITRDEVGAAMRNAFQLMGQQRLQEYFSLPPGPQRTAVLDKMIDEAESRRREREARAATRPARPEEGGSDAEREERREERRRRFNSPERVKSMMENIPPGQRAQWAEFRNDLRKRREERGLPDRGWGGGGR